MLSYICVHLEPCAAHASPIIAGHFLALHLEASMPLKKISQRAQKDEKRRKQSAK